MAGMPAPGDAGLTKNVLYLVDEVENYFGGDYEGYDGIGTVLGRLEQALTVDTKLVLLTQPQLDVVLAALDGFSPAACTESHVGDPSVKVGTEYDEDDHGDETRCFGYGPKALAQLALAQDAIATVAREA